LRVCHQVQQCVPFYFKQAYLILTEEIKFNNDHKLLEFKTIVKPFSAAFRQVGFPQVLQVWANLL